MNNLNLIGLDLYVILEIRFVQKDEPENMCGL